MDQQHGLIGLCVQIAHDFLNLDVQKALLGPHIGRGCVPRRRQIVRELEKEGAIDLRPRRSRRAKVHQPALEFIDPL